MLTLCMYRIDRSHKQRTLSNVSFYVHAAGIRTSRLYA